MILMLYHLFHFDHSQLDERLRWFCPPQVWSIERSCLIISPAAQTDFWQRTHYGFQNDNGHILGMDIWDDFTLITRVRFYPVHQYDQAGLMVRINEQNWVKTSVEYEPDGHPRLGVVVTREGYSDWSTQDYEGPSDILLRIKREGADCIVDFHTVTVQEELPEAGWIQMRVAHLTDVQPAFAGLYACSPINSGFKAEFDFLAIQSE
jgi:hypothetical protein